MNIKSLEKKSNRENNLKFKKIKSFKVYKITAKLRKKNKTQHYIIRQQNYKI